MPNRNFLAFIVSEVSAFIRTARQPGIRAWQAKIGLELDRHGRYERTDQRTLLTRTERQTDRRT